MITDFNGDKCTAKRLAQDVVYNYVKGIVVGEYLESCGFKLTERELEQVQLQLYKLTGRVAKICGYDD